MNEQTFSATYYTKDSDKYIKLEAALDPEDNHPFGIQFGYDEYDMQYLSTADVNELIKNLKAMQARRKAG